MFNTLIWNRRFYGKRNSLDLNYGELRTCIFKMRAIVNKISIVNVEVTPSTDKLILRCQLEELMIEYIELRKPEFDYSQYNSVAKK